MIKTDQTLLSIQADSSAKLDKSVARLGTSLHTALTPWSCPGTRTHCTLGRQGYRIQQFRLPSFLSGGRGTAGELPPEVIHQHLQQTSLPREIQLGFYPNTPSLTQFLSLSSQDLLVEISLAEPKLVFHRHGKKKLSVEAICAGGHTSFL